MRKFFVFLGFPAMISLFAGCGTYEKIIPSSRPMPIDNVYTRVEYDHSQIITLLVLPLDNPYQEDSITNHEKEITQILIRNFNKYNYFNLVYDPEYTVHGGEVVNLNSGIVDRTLLGAVGKHYHADAVMQIRVADFQPFSPMRMRVKGMIVDVRTGERVWDFDHVFDSDDKDVVNAMRYWWNTHRAGGEDNAEKRFMVSRTRPSFFLNFVFHRTANSYGLARGDVIRSVLTAKKEQERSIKELNKLKTR